MAFIDFWKNLPTRGLSAGTPLVDGGGVMTRPESDQPVPVHAGQIDEVLTLPGKGREAKFAASVRELIKDEAFISKVSDEVGEPTEGESEQHFVHRASNVLRTQLRKALGID